MKSFLLTLIILLLSCCSKNDLSTNIDKNILKKYAVDLKGKILDKDNKAVKGAVALMKHINKKDTTDENGEYEIQTDSIPSEGKDTLVILKESQILDVQEITVFVDSLPPLYIVQRDVYGSLDMIDSSQIGHIEAVLTGDNISGEKKIPLAWNKAANSFTTFFYMKNVLGTQYKIYVSVFDDKNRFIARSPDVEFTDLFGDIQVPVFACNNAKPIAIAKADKDTVSIGDSIVISADSSYDPFNGEITKYEWNVNGKGYNEGNADTGISVPTSLPLLKVSAGMAENGELNVVLKVMDNDQNEGLDTVTVNVVQDVPVVQLPNDTNLPSHATITIKPEISDGFGTIVSNEWNIDGQIFQNLPETTLNIVNIYPADSLGYTEVNNPDGGISRLNIANVIKNIPINICATDDDGNTSCDSMNINIAADQAPSIEFLDLDSSLGDYFAIANTPDSVAPDSVTINVQIKDDGIITKYEWFFGIIQVTSTSCRGSGWADEGMDTAIIGTGESITIPTGLLTFCNNNSQNSHAMLKVTDDAGNITIKSLYVHFMSPQL